MKDVNYILRKAYVAALNGLTVGVTTVETYYLTLPQELDADAYILLVSPSNVDNSTFSSSDTKTSIQVQIHTKSTIANAGKIADDIAHEVYSRIYPQSNSNLDLSADGVQLVSTNMENDIVQDYGEFGQDSFVSRIITFSHQIFHK